MSVVYKSDSIFEAAAARKTVMEDYLREYMPKEGVDSNGCDILLSSSEYTVDSRGHFCKLMDLDPDTSCCMEEYVTNATKHNE